MGKKSKKQKKSKKKSSSSSSTSKDSKAGEGERFCALIFFLASIGLWFTSKQVGKAVTINVDLAHHARSACQELDWAAFNTDPDSFANDGCYYWNSDFRISEDVGDKQSDFPIFNDAYQGRALQFHREIYQYQMWEVEVCESHKRSGESVNATFTLYNKDSWSEEETQRYADFKASADAQSKSDCRTELRSGWNTQNHWYNHNDGQHYDFDFPSAGNSEAAAGHKMVHNINTASVLIESESDATPDGQDFDVDNHKLTNAVLNYDWEYNKEDVAKSACNGIVWGHANKKGRNYLDFIDGMGQTEFYSDPVRENDRKTKTGHSMGIELHTWQDDMEVSKKSLCVQKNSNSDSWALQETSDFVADSGYGDAIYYPSCDEHSNELQLGDYLFNAYNQGHDHDNNFVVASIRKDDAGDMFTVEPYKNLAFGDTSDALPTFLFLYKDHEEGKEFASHIDEHIDWLREAGGAAQFFLYFMAAMAFIISGTCTKAADKKQRGSSSS